MQEGCYVGSLGSSSIWVPRRPELLPCRERLAARLYLPTAVPLHPAAAAAAVPQFFGVPLPMALHTSASTPALLCTLCPAFLHLSSCSCLALPAPPPSLASAVFLPLAAFLSWCRSLLSILLLAGRMSCYACQTALLLFKDADSGSLTPSGKAESLSDLTKQGNKPVRVISIWSIF